MYLHFLFTVVVADTIQGKSPDTAVAYICTFCLYSAERYI